MTTAFALDQRPRSPTCSTRGNGSVVNITSAMGRFRDRGFVAYGTAKAALAHMTRLLAADCAPKVRVNAVAPGSIATSALEIVLTRRADARRDGATDAAAAPRRRRRHRARPCSTWRPTRRSYVTGKILEVDGGIEASNLDMHLPDL